MTKYVRWLDLSHNDLTSLPDEFCAFGYALDELHIRHNRLHGLPQNIAQLQVILTMGTRRHGKGGLGHFSPAWKCCKVRRSLAIIVKTCVLRATTKKVVAFLRKKSAPLEKNHAGVQTHLFSLY